MIISQNGVSGYFYPPEGTHHVIVATTDNMEGDVVHEIWHNAGANQGTAPLGDPFKAGSIVGVAGFSGFGDNHAIVAQQDGTITEMWWEPGQGVHVDRLGQFLNAPITAMNAYFTADEFAHILVALGPGESGVGSIQQIRYSPAVGVETLLVGFLPPRVSAVALTGYDDTTSLGGGQGLETVWAATNDFNIRKVQLKGGVNSDQTFSVWGSLPPPSSQFRISGISGFADPRPYDGHCYVTLFVSATNADNVSAISVSYQGTDAGVLNGICYPAGGQGNPGEQWTDITVTPFGIAPGISAISAYPVGSENYLVYAGGNQLGLLNRKAPADDRTWWWQISLGVNW